MGWFAVYTRPQAEAIAYRDLGRIGFTTFYPTYRVRRHVRRGNAMVPRWINKPYFPRWLFVNIPMDSLYEVMVLRSVAAIGSVGDRPVEVPSAVMQVLMAGADAEGIMGSRDEVSRKRFAAAASVRFLPGSPLAKMVGIVINDDGGNTVDVLISMLGSNRQVTAPAEVLQLVA